jgi:hypothetical protein
MSRIDDILAKQKALAGELELAKQEERDNVLKDIKEKIKMFDFKASDFKGLLKSRVTQKQVEDFMARKEAAKSKPKTATRAKKSTG